MNNTILYFIEANTCLIFFFCLYLLFLRKESNFVFQRLFLLGGVICSLVIPLVKVNLLPVSIPMIPAMNTNPTLILSPVTVMAGQASSFAIGDIAIRAYLAISFLFLCTFVLKLARLARLLKHSGDSQEIKNPLGQQVFSFFNYIHIGNSFSYSSSEKNMMILHEQVHARELHSMDVLLLELIKIVFWFNPIIYFYQSAVQSVHEFHADEVVVNKHSNDEYARLLAKGGLLSAGISIVSTFHSARILQRISKINSDKSIMKNWKSLLLGVLVAGLFMVVSCRDQVDQSSLSKNLDQATQEEIIAQHKILSEVAGPNSKSEFVFVANTKDNEKLINEYYDRKDLCSTRVLKIPQSTNSTGRTFILFEFGDRMERLATLPKDETSIFPMGSTDEPAAPIFGFDGFMKNLSYVLQYPEAEKSKGIEGTVYVEALISTTGKVSDVNVIKGVSDGLDTEAMRAILQVGNQWKPAIHNDKIVNQKVIIPVRFALNQGD